MSSPTHPYGVRFVPETTKSSQLELRLSAEFASSFNGIATLIQTGLAFCTFVTAISSRTHNYELSGLTVYVAPKATPIFVVASTFFLFYFDLLLIAAALFSNFDVGSLQLSLFYLMVMASGSVFNIASAAAFFVGVENPMEYVLGALCSVCAFVYTVRVVLIMWRMRQK